MVYGLLAVILHRKELNIKRSYREAILLVLMTVWAFIGNTLYSGSVGSYSEDFNWFFIKRDPFDAIPENLASYLTPVANFVSFFGMAIIIYLIFAVINKKQPKKSEKKDNAEEKATVSV